MKQAPSLEPAPPWDNRCTDCAPASAAPTAPLPVRTPTVTVPIPQWTRVSPETLTRVRAALIRL
jgi:hypothetical protein